MTAEETLLIVKSLVLLAGGEVEVDESTIPRASRGYDLQVETLEPNKYRLRVLEKGLRLVR